MNATQILEQIAKQARNHKPSVRHVATMKDGEVARQGDVYLTMASDAAVGAEITERQLAPGTTKGSRHVCTAPSAKLYAPAETSPLTGPVIDCPDERVVVEHPEHGWLDLPPGRYQVTYQRDYAREREQEIRRVMD